MRMIVVLLAALLAAPLAADAQSTPAPETHGIVVANMDRSVKPGDDFYHYANGAWIKRTEIPADRGYIDPYGGDYEDDSNDLTRKRIAGLIEERFHPEKVRVCGVLRRNCGEVPKLEAITF